MYRLKKQIDYAKFTENSIVTLDIDYAERLLLKLTEQYESPTLEEVIKEWEELGYEWRIPKEYPHMIWLVNDDEEERLVLRIKINTQSKSYWKLWGDGGFDKFTFQEHQLLTKTMKALGWL